MTSLSTLIPELSYSTYQAGRMLFGILLLLFLIQILPMWRYYFISEKWGGYTENSSFHNKIQNPYVIPVLLALWFLSSFGLIFAKWTLAASFFQWLMSRYFFIKMRWINLARGLGAPGFITYWLSTAFFLLEFSLSFAPQYVNIVLWAFQIDFGLILLAAGYYKYKAGYPQNDGMELGMINPEWGYWIPFFKKFSPYHLIFRVFNQLAWSTEIIAAVLMLIPQTRFYGGVLLILIFFFILTQLRLGFLCEMVICIGFLYFCAGHPLEPFIQNLFDSNLPEPIADVAWLGKLLYAIVVVYILMLPLAYTGLCVNFYLKKKLPGVLQEVLDRYTNFFGMILWRVFSSDVTNFYVNIYAEDNQGQRRPISNYAPFRSIRFNQVAECIAVTTIFSSLKYFSRESGVFDQRLWRYSKTLGASDDEKIIYEYVSIQKDKVRFYEKPVSEFSCQPLTGEILEKIIDPSFSTSAKANHSPIHQTNKPGSYTPS